MKLIFLIFFFSQLLNFLGAFAEKVKEYSSELNPIKWEKIEKKKSNKLKKIIWKPYKSDENFIENVDVEGSTKTRMYSSSEKNK